MTLKLELLSLQKSEIWNFYREKMSAQTRFRVSQDEKATQIAVILLSCFVRFMKKLYLYLNSQKNGLFYLDLDRFKPLTFVSRATFNARFLVIIFRSLFFDKILNSFYPS